MELLGYASGDDHLYLVYEYVPNGSLSEHLHDPLLKGISMSKLFSKQSKPTRHFMTQTQKVNSFQKIKPSGERG